MAEKRMFSKKIIDTDWFMDMPASTQNLYFHLSMRADDDGFVASPKRIIKLIGASDDDYRVLIAKHFIIPFESGVCVISDWRINNYLRSDRYTETTYKEEKKMLSVNENGKYELGIPSGIPMVDTDIYLSNSKSNTISNTNIDNKENKHKYGEYNKVLLKDSEYNKLVEEYGEDNTKEAIRYLDEYIAMKGVKYKSHYLAMRKWVFDAVKEKIQRAVNKQYIKPKQQTALDIASDVDRLIKNVR